MSLGQHLEELRKRLVLALAGMLPILVVTLAFGREILEILMLPVRSALRAEGLPSSLQATGVLETFNTYFKVSVVLTLVLAGPWVLYQLWKFVAPGLYRHEQRFVYILLPMSTLLALVGVAFLYTVILPVMLVFLVHFGAQTGVQAVPTAPLPEGMALPTLPVLAADPPAPAVGQAWINGPLRQWRVCVGMNGSTPVVLGSELTTMAGILQQYRVSDYVSLVLSLALAFAGGFQMPVLVLLLGWAGIVDRPWLAKYRRHAALVILVLAAALTPGDPWSMLLLAAPLYGLYELGGWLLKVLPAERVGGREEPAGEPATAGDE